MDASTTRSVSLKVGNHTRVSMHTDATGAEKLVTPFRNCSSGQPLTLVYTVTRGAGTPFVFTSMVSPPP
jgi:hypothetical protein